LKRRQVTIHNSNEIIGPLDRERPTNPAGGHISTSSKRTTKGDIIKIGTTDVVIQENKDGPMIFGESAKKKIQLPTKQPIQNTPCPDGAHRD
jgi:hypothetical protein